MPKSSSVIKSPCIIFVEHDFEIRELYKEILTEAGYRIFVCAALTPAIKAVIRHKPILVFVDVDLPGGGALKLLRHIDKSSSKAGIVLLSNYEEKMAVRRHLGREMSNIIETFKANPDEIITLVHRLLSKVKA